MSRGEPNESVAFFCVVDQDDDDDFGPAGDHGSGSDDALCDHMSDDDTKLQGSLMN